MVEFALRDRAGRWVKVGRGDAYLRVCLAGLAGRDPVVLEAEPVQPGRLLALPAGRARAKQWSDPVVKRRCREPACCGNAQEPRVNASQTLVKRRPNIGQTLVKRRQSAGRTVKRW